MVDVAANYSEILSRMNEAAAQCGRNPNDIKLLGASKSQSFEAIRAAVRAGVKLIGENYVQEAKEKKDQIPESAEWHMIGHLQRNKAKAAIELFDVIESLDNLTLARALDKEARKRAKAVRIFVEVNLGNEESKSGIAKEQLIALVEGMAPLSNLRVMGLMTVPPFRKNLNEVRPYFRELSELRERLNELRLPNVDLRELSMGMTHDYTVAIEEGATIVRIGTALFGPRSQ
jgi:pyridoxal phosphate enzyme (YggS family)